MKEKKPDPEKIKVILHRLQGFGGNPYTSMWCKKDAGHEALKPVEKNGTIYLVCPNCDYEEELGPEYFED